MKASFQLRIIHGSAPRRPSPGVVTLIEPKPSADEGFAPARRAA